MQRQGISIITPTPLGRCVLYWAKASKKEMLFLIWYWKIRSFYLLSFPFLVFLGFEVLIFLSAAAAYKSFLLPIDRC